MLYEFLKDNYKEAEPIFFSDIVIKGITKSAVNQQLKKLCDEGKLQICFQRWKSRWFLFG